jgi:hypothetical protein
MMTDEMTRALEREVQMKGEQAHRALIELKRSTEDAIAGVEAWMAGRAARSDAMVVSHQAVQDAQVFAAEFRTLAQMNAVVQQELVR